MQTSFGSYHSDLKTHVPLKINLFTRIHEMESLVNQLSLISQLPREERRKWLDENESLLRSSLDLFVSHANVEFQGDGQMDTQMVSLLMEYTSKLQNLMAVVQTLFVTKNGGNTSKSKKKAKKTNVPL